MSSQRIHARFLVCVTASLVLAGCGTGQPTTGTSENLLTTEGAVQTANGAPDPLTAHMVARSQVDPKDMSETHPYTVVEMSPDDIGKGSKPVNENERLGRLENQVAELHSDFKKLMPTLSEASSEAIKTEEQLVALAKQPVPAEAAPQAIAPAAGTVAATIQNTTSSVTKVRFGEHPGKTRIVLDMDAPGKFVPQLDNGQNVLKIDLPQSAWTAAVQESIAGNGLITGYNIAPSPAGGVTLTIQLRKPAKLVMSAALPPNEAYGNRIVFDVAPL